MGDHLCPAVSAADEQQRAVVVVIDVARIRAPGMVHQREKAATLPPPAAHFATLSTTG